MILSSYGRKPAVLTPTVVAGIFAFGAGAGKDIQTVIICRFFEGFFGSAPVTNTGGVLGGMLIFDVIRLSLLRRFADIWRAEQRGMAMVGYAMALVGGPTLGTSQPKHLLSEANFRRLLDEGALC